MRLPHHRSFHRPRTAPSTLNPQPSTHIGFTLIELIIVILVMLILLTLTVALVSDVLDSGRVSGAARQIQNYLAGARDRAIYSASRVDPDSTFVPRVGVRFFADPSLYDAVSGDPRGFSSMVFIQETAPVRFQMEVNTSVTPPTVSQFDPIPGEPFAKDTPSLAVGNLINRGLVPWFRNAAGDKVYYLLVTFEQDDSQKKYFVKFLDDAAHMTDFGGNSWLSLGELSAGPLPGVLAGTTGDFIVHLRPAPLPNEEPRLFPDGTIVEIQSSLIGSGPRAGVPLTENASLNSQLAGGSFDILFNGQGVVDGRLAAAGLIHLVVADLEDIERGFRVVFRNNAGTPAVLSDDTLEVGSPFLDQDDDPALAHDTHWTNGINPVLVNGEPVLRQGDVRIVSLRTRTGSAYASDINPIIDQVPASPTYRRLTDPFYYAETGAEAK